MMTNPLSASCVYRRRARLAVVAALLLPLLLAVGCGKKGSTHYTVSGRVSISGKPPVSGSSVVFVGPDNREVSGLIDDDGSYSVVDPPLGDNQIAVKGPLTEAPEAPPPGAETLTGASRAGGVPVPKKYENPGNGLSYTVTRAKKQTYDISLTP